MSHLAFGLSASNRFDTTLNSRSAPTRKKALFWFLLSFHSSSLTLPLSSCPQSISQSTFKHHSCRDASCACRDAEIIALVRSNLPLIFLLLNHTKNPSPIQV